MYKNIRTNHIKLNRKKPAIDYRLEEGDVLNLYLSDESLFKKEDYTPIKPELNVVFEDANILIVNKPALMSCHDESTSLIEHVKSYLYLKGEFNPLTEHSFSPALCNRLDTNTRGLVIAAKNAEALRVINQKIADKEIKKFYLCRVKGTPPKKKDILHGYLLKDPERNRSIIVESPQAGAVEVKTGYRIIKSDGETSLLEIELFTGRSHQIRAHMASIGCPIVGDYKYLGGNSVPYQELIAYKLIFNFGSPACSLDYLKGKTVMLEGLDEAFK